MVLLPDPAPEIRPRRYHVAESDANVDAERGKRGSETPILWYEIPARQDGEHRPRNRNLHPHILPIRRRQHQAIRLGGKTNEDHGCRNTHDAYGLPKFVDAIE